MDTKNNIPVLFQPSSQTDPNFRNQTKDTEVKDNFQNIFEETAHKVKKAEQYQNQTPPDNEETQSRRVQDQSKTYSKNSKNNLKEKEPSPQSNPTSTQNSVDQAPEKSVKNSAVQKTYEGMMVEKLKSLGLDNKDIQRFLDLFDSKSIQISNKSIYSLRESNKDLLQAGAIGLNLANLKNETQSNKDFLQAGAIRLNFADLENETQSNKDLLQAGAIRLNFADLENATENGPDLKSLALNALDFLTKAGVNEDSAKQVVRQIVQSASEVKNSQETLLKLSRLNSAESLEVASKAKNSPKILAKLSDLQALEKSDSISDAKNSQGTPQKLTDLQLTEELNPSTQKLTDLQLTEELNPSTDKKNRIVKQVGQIAKDDSDTTKFKITYKQFQEETKKDSRLDTTDGKLVDRESSKGTQIRIHDPVMRTFKTDINQQSSGTEVRIQAAGLNFHNTQDSFTQFHQNLGKAHVEVMPQNTTPLANTFSDTLREFDINRSTLPKNISERSIIDQVVQKFSLRGNAKNTEIRMRLEPPSLGTVRMNVTTQGETIKTTIFAESHAVKNVIENNLSQLKDSFSDQGLKVESFQVTVGGEPSFKNQKQPQQRSNYHHRLDLGQEDLLDQEQLESSTMQMAFSRNNGGLSVII